MALFRLDREMMSRLITIVQGLIGQIGGQFKVWHAREQILPMEGLTADPLCKIVNAMSASLPKGNYDSLTTAQKAVADASVYIGMHRIPQAIEILRTVVNDNTANTEWLLDLISLLEAAVLLPGTGLDDFKKSRERERLESKHLFETQ